MDGFKTISQGGGGLFCGSIAITNVVNNVQWMDNKPHREIKMLCRWVEENLVLKEREIGLKISKVIGDNFKIQVIDSVCQLLELKSDYYGKNKASILKVDMDQHILATIVNTGGHYVAIISRNKRFFKLDSMGTLIQEMTRLCVEKYINSCCFVRITI